MQTMWKALDRFLGRIDSAIERKRLQESFDHPLIKRVGRETLRYYENGRSTAIVCDLAIGCRDLDLLIYNKAPLRWLDTGDILTPEESKRVYSKLPDLLARENIRWAYSETIQRTV